MRRLLALVATAAAALCAGYAGGTLGIGHNRLPLHLLTNAWESLRRPEAERVLVDSKQRLVHYPDKVSLACPPQDDATAVILMIGQSNGANELGQGGVSRHGDDIVAWFEGGCTRAASPLLGTTGVRGEAWTVLANKLVEAGVYRRVVIVPAAVGGTAIARWTAGGDLNEDLMTLLERLKASYRPTHVVWIQGEDDYEQHTEGDRYARDFLALADTIRARSVSAPIFVTRATLCGPQAGWHADNPIGRTQARLADRAAGIYAGVDTDSLLGPEDRMDGCHFAGSGVAKFTDAMRDIFVAQAQGSLAAARRAP